MYMTGQRLIEALLIAVLTAAGTGFTVTIRLDERYRHQSAQIRNLVEEIRELRSAIGVANVAMGNRWTATDQRDFERVLYKRFDDHDIRGH